MRTVYPSGNPLSYHGWAAYIAEQAEKINNRDKEGMTVELFQKKSGLKHVYVFTDSIEIKRRIVLHTVTAKANSPFPDKMTFGCESEMFRKVARMAEVYGYEVQYLF